MTYSEKVVWGKSETKRRRNTFRHLDIPRGQHSHVCFFIFWNELFPILQKSKPVKELKAYFSCRTKNIWSWRFGTNFLKVTKLKNLRNKLVMLSTIIKNVLPPYLINIYRDILNHGNKHRSDGELCTSNPKANDYISIAQDHKLRFQTE